MAKTHHASALDQIDATIQPMGPQPALRAEVDQLVKLNDITALVALYDAFAAAALTFQAIQTGQLRTKWRPLRKKAPTHGPRRSMSPIA